MAELLTKVEKERQLHDKRKSIKILGKLQQYTTWLQNIERVVDVAVQTQAGIACPLWAPIKLVLKVYVPLRPRNGEQKSKPRAT